MQGTEFDFSIRFLIQSPTLSFLATMKFYSSSKIVLFLLFFVSTLDASLFTRDPGERLKKLVRQKGWFETCRRIHGGKEQWLARKSPELAKVCEPILQFGSEHAAFIQLCQFPNASETLELMTETVGPFGIDTFRAGMMRAAQFGRITALDHVRRLLAASWDTSEWVPSVMLSAASAGRLEVIEYLSDEGLTAETSDAQQAFVAAAENGHTDVMEYFLKTPLFSASVNLAMELAASRGHIGIVRRLFPYTTYSSTDLQPPTDPSGLGTLTSHQDEFLVHVAKYGITEILLQLLGRVGRADTNVGGRALLAAAQNGQAGTLRLLLAMGADVHYESDQAIVLAAQSGNAAVVRILLEYGVNVHALSEAALQHAVVRGHRDVVEALLEGGASVEKSGDGPLAIAELKGYDEIMRLLTAQTVRPETRVRFQHRVRDLDEPMHRYSPKPARRSSLRRTQSSPTPFQGHRVATAAAASTTFAGDEVPQEDSVSLQDSNLSELDRSSTMLPVMPSDGSEITLDSAGRDAKQSEISPEGPLMAPIVHELTNSILGDGFEAKRKQEKLQMRRQRELQQQLKLERQRQQHTQPRPVLVDVVEHTEPLAAPDAHQDAIATSERYPPIAYHLSDSAQSYVRGAPLLAAMDSANGDSSSSNTAIITATTMDNLPTSKLSMYPDVGREYLVGGIPVFREM